MKTLQKDLTAGLLTNQLTNQLDQNVINFWQLHAKLSMNFSLTLVIVQLINTRLNITS